MTPVAGSKVKPSGRAPAMLSVGAGSPVAVTTNEFSRSTTKVAVASLVNAGAPVTVRVKAWVAAGSTPLLAVMVTANVPAWVGVPARTPSAARVTPSGSTPSTANVGAG
jgi:hypothetical protein